jgi:acyl-coenzyme A synthetase/AMP-(fatty) acid ligase
MGTACPSHQTVVQPEPGTTTSESVLADMPRRMLRSELPHDMVPSRIKTVASMPSSVNGKVDQRKRDEMLDEPSRPRTDLQVH